MHTHKIDCAVLDYWWWLLGENWLTDIQTDTSLIRWYIFVILLSKHWLMQQQKLAKTWDLKQTWLLHLTYLEEDKICRVLCNQANTVVSCVFPEVPNMLLCQRYSLRFPITITVNFQEEQTESQNEILHGLFRCLERGLMCLYKIKNQEQQGTH